MRSVIYRALMKVAHRYDWHHMPKYYPNGDTMVWCRWCGARDVIARRQVADPPQEQQAQAARGDDFGGGDVQDGGSWS